MNVFLVRGINGCDLNGDAACRWHPKKPAWSGEPGAEDDQTVKGIIIALEDDQRIRRALAIVPSIVFYRYQISFKLVKS